MQEAFLHYIWKHSKFTTKKLLTTSQEAVTILSLGQHNHHAGPDFFNAKIQIGDQLWAGNVEIHSNASDWYVHNHEQDKNYDNVILHVVWQHDTEIFRKDNTVLPTLELKNYVNASLLNNYKQLFNTPNTWINCENQFPDVSNFLLDNWLERLYFERLENKSVLVEQLLTKSKNNWEAVLFTLLAKNFGLKVNAQAFLSIAQSIDFSIIRKLQSKPQQLEALFFGQAGLLEDAIQEPYYQGLVKDYTFLKQKFQLKNQAITPLQFFRLRPPNFPTIRLSQLAILYHTQQSLFASIIDCKTLEDFYKLFTVSTASFWESHYTFEKASRKSKKTTTKAFIDLLLINTVLPVRFSYDKHQGKTDNDTIVAIMQQIRSEKNSIVNRFKQLKKLPDTALNSQALLELKTNYCDKNKCLQCAVGNTVISQ